MSGNPSFDQIASATLRNYKDTLISNLFGKQALYWQLQQRGFVTTDQGGTSLTHPILYGRNNTVKSFSGWDIIPTTPQSGITTAELAWKYFAGTVTISKTEEFENSGKAKIFSLLDGKIQQLEESFQLELNTQIYGDGTGNGGKDITGLALAVEDGSAWATYAGIDRSVAANAFWRNQWIGAGGDVFDASSGASYKGLIHWRKMYNDTSFRGTTPTLIITNQDVFEKYESILESKVQLVKSDLKMGDAGFVNLTFKQVPVVFDVDLNADTTLFLNSNFMKFVIGQGMNFVTTPFQTPENQLGKVSTTYFAGNLIVYKPDQQGRITSLPAA